MPNLASIVNNIVSDSGVAITSTQVTNWDSAYGWGNHASAGYLTTSSAASTYQPLDADLTAIAGLAGTSGFLKKTAANTWSLDTSTYLTSYTETDPIYVASSWYSTTNNASNWNTAYGWGNHASAGYLTSITSSNVTTALGYTPVTNARTLTINGTTYDLTANRSWTISGSDSTKLPLAGGTMTGQIVSTVTEAFKMTSDNCYISGWNTAGTTRYGYLQFATGALNIGAEAGTAMNLIVAGASTIYANTSNNVGFGTTSPLSKVHVIGDVRTTGLRLNTHTTNNQGHRIYSRTMDVNSYTTNTSMRFAVTSGYAVQFQYEVTFHATRTTSGNLSEIWYLKYTAGIAYNTSGNPDERWWDLREQAGNGIAGVGRSNQTGYFDIHNSAYDSGCRLTCVVAITCSNWDAVTVTFP